MGKAKNDLDEIFVRLREQEALRVKDSTIQETILHTLTEFATMFEKHDEKEMAKYDLYDVHVSEQTATLITLSAKIETVSESRGAILREVSEIRDEIKTLKEQVIDLTKRQWIALGVTTGVMAIVGSLWLLFSFMNGVADKKDREIAELVKSAKVMRSAQDRAYDRERMLSEYGIKIGDKK